MDFQNDSAYQTLVLNISQTLQNAKKNAKTVVNVAMVHSHWEVGRYIMEYEQKGKLRAEYGRKLLIELAKDLRPILGKGYSRSNLSNMRLCYKRYPIIQALPGQLGWSHVIELISIDGDLERSFYEQQSVIENWGYRELARQKKSALFQRLALSKDKEAILTLAKEGQKIETEYDLIKDPYIFEFLGLPTHTLTREKDLEAKLIEHLQHFLLELGKGFAFIGSQYKITIDNTHFFVDLVFYHRILKCFVLIDLKTDKVKHLDIGQMNLYINYFKTEENVEGDNEPIGIVLSSDKNDTLVEYMLGGITNKLLVAKYQLYLPDKELLTQKVREILEA